MPPNKSSKSTIRDIARLSGVSTATVSRYLNNTATVSPEVSARLQQVMIDLNYVPHAAARNLATHKTNTVGLLIDAIQGDFFTPLLSGIESVTSEAGYDLLIYSTGRRPLHTHTLLPLGPQNADGCLIFAHTMEEDDLIRYLKYHLPVVLIHQSSPASFDIPCVTVENKAASRKIVDHLIEQHGRRRIVYLRGLPKHEDSIWRETGYRESLEAHGIPYDPQLIAAGEFDRQVACLSIQSLLSVGIDFDGVFSGDDEAAVGVLSALRVAGKDVPAAISVVGFDDQRLSAYLDPPLTTVRAPTEEVGRVAAKQLIQLIQTAHAESLTLLPTEMIIRRSCGCSA